MSMGKTPEGATELMQALWKPAVARVGEEVADMQAMAEKDGVNISIEPWDYRYYAEKVRKARFDVDDNAVTPYLQLEKLREAMFWVAGELLGLRFSRAEGVPVYHPDVRVWEVRNETGKHVALFYFDPYAREGKRSGAWMNAYRNQERFDGEITTLVSNNCNFVKGKPGEPVLVSWSDATTLFHEFGHALHGISSSVKYPSLSGTNVDRDYVEFPSQLLDQWLPTEAGGPYDKAVAGRLRTHVFSVGNTVDPAEGYRAFRGRDAKIDALMRRRGFGSASAGQGQ